MKTTRRKKIRRIRRKTIGGNDTELDTHVEPEPEADTGLEPELDTGLEPELDTGLEPELDTGLEPELDEVEEEDEEEIPVEPEYARYVEYFNTLFPDGKKDEEYYERYKKFLQSILKTTNYSENAQILDKIKTLNAYKNQYKSDYEQTKHVPRIGDGNKADMHKKQREIDKLMLDNFGMKRKKYLIKIDKHSKCGFSDEFIVKLWETISKRQGYEEFSSRIDKTVDKILNSAAKIKQYTPSDDYREDRTKYALDRYSYFIILINLLEAFLLVNVKRCVSSIRKIDHFDRLMNSTIKSVNEEMPNPPAEGGRKTRRKQKKQRKTRKQRKYKHNKN
jgi:hypothetical protein